MMRSVAGTTTASFSFARCMYSYWPDQVMEYPAGSSTIRSTISFASAT